ncbi:MAG: hypothetical protein AAF502_02810 [Bacteroidota bacterium]
MKKLVFGLLTFFVIGSLSSCVSNRGCNGSWYNNRNVQVEPAKQQLKNFYFKEELCQEEDTAYSE